MRPPPIPIEFTPVPLSRVRRDGWTPDVQRRFIAALAHGLSITAAARLVGRSRQKAYALRNRPGAASFAAAWDQAMATAPTRQRPGPNRQVARPGTIAEGRLVWAQLGRIERKFGGTFARPSFARP